MGKTEVVFLIGSNRLQKLGVHFVILESENIQIYTLHFCQGEPQLTEQKNRKNLGFTLTIYALLSFIIKIQLSHFQDIAI